LWLLPSLHASYINRCSCYMCHVSGAVAGIQMGVQGGRDHCVTPPVAGNKLFQGTLIGIMSPGASVLQVGGRQHLSHVDAGVVPRQLLV
jgi:hypothetical protein